MLDSLAGTLISFDEDFAVVDVNGLRFRTEIPGSTARQLPQPGEPVQLLTRLSFNANDGSFSLYGFAMEVERDCFDILTSLSGIGPRKALAILSQIDIASFANAVVNRDLAYVSRLKGVGRKTAERLIVELREKMMPYAGVAPEPGIPSLSGKENVRDAVEAMVALGCRPAVAETAIAKAVDVLGDEAKTENLIREGLKHR